MPEKRWYPVKPEYITDDGGGLYADDLNYERIVALTNRGEFAVEMTEDGDLLAYFPEKGVMYAYDGNGDLSIAVLNLNIYLNQLDSRDLEQMPYGGKDLAELARVLRMIDTSLVISIRIEDSHDIKLLTISSEGKQEIIKEMDGVNLRKGLKGELSVEGFGVAFRITRLSDSLMLEIGEPGVDLQSALCTEASLQIDPDLIEHIFGDEPNRMQKLAENVLL